MVGKTSSAKIMAIACAVAGITVYGTDVKANEFTTSDFDTDRLSSINMEAV